MKILVNTRILMGGCLVIILCSYIASKSKIPFSVPAFATGETLHYRVHYGFLNAGRAKLEISNKLYRVSNHICYRIEVSGSSVGAFDRMLRIRNTWGTYMDTSVYLPLKSFRNIEENRYRKRDETFFDYPARTARIVEDGRKDDKIVKIPSDIQDLVSGYYYMRVLDYTKLKTNDTIKVNGILENDTYMLKIVYRGRQTIKTKFGKINALVLTPVMPANGMFEGESSIRLWLSDDINKVPVKLRAEMFVGGVELDLTDYKNLKAPLKFF